MQTFPEPFVFVGNHGAIEQAIGNAVPVTMRGGEVMVEGADGLREVAFYGLDGACLGVVPVVDGRAQIETEREVVIVRIGDRAVKVVR